jgi:hypothetical protein
MSSDTPARSDRIWFRKGGQRPANDKVVDFQMSQLALAQLGDQGKTWHASQTPDFLATKQRWVG